MKFRLLPIIILVIVSCINLGITIERHGKVGKVKVDAWHTLIAWLIQWGLILWAIL